MADEPFAKISVLSVQVDDPNHPVVRVRVDTRGGQCFIYAVFEGDEIILRKENFSRFMPAPARVQ